MSKYAVVMNDDEVVLVDKPDAMKITEFRRNLTIIYGLRIKQIKKVV